MELPSVTITLLSVSVASNAPPWESAPAALRQGVAHCGAVLAAAFQQHGGVTVRPRSSTGNSGAIFGSAADALAAALIGQRALAAGRVDTAEPVLVRMALHTEAADPSVGYAGAERHCAGILAAVPEGQILLSQATAGRLGGALPGGTRLVERGRHRCVNGGDNERLFELMAPDLPPHPQNPQDCPWPVQLPAQLTSFIGRERELVEVAALVRRQRLVTLTGPGGSGKTRLGLQAAATLTALFPDGVVFVDLAAVGDTPRLLSTLARTLGLLEIGRAATADDLGRALGARRSLLLLDNFEQIVEAAPLLSYLLGACAGLSLLVTSRVPLRVSGEYEFDVPPLALVGEAGINDFDAVMAAPAVQLFSARAAAARADFAVTVANSSTVAQICRRLDGLPLAIELAAAQVRMLSPPALLARLNGRLALLVGGARDRPARQRTLRATMDWSYGLLRCEEQAVFRRLGVFAGTCSLAAIAAVCLHGEQSADEALTVLSGLVEQHLVVPRRDSSAEPVFALLETARAYALERLDATGETAAVRRRHAAYFLDLAEAAGSLEASRDPEPWASRLAAERHNLAAALEWAVSHQQTEIVLRLVAALGWYWCRRAEIAEGRRWAECALTLPRAAEYGIAYAGAVLSKQLLYEVDGTRLPDLQPALEQAVHVFAEAGDTRGAARACLAICVNQPRAAAQRAAIVRARTLFLAAGDMMGWARASIFLSDRLFVEGEVETAGRVLDEAIAALRTQQDRLALAAALRTLTERHVVADRHEPACAAAEEALGLARQSGGGVLVSVLLDLLTLIADRLENERLAAALLGESRALSQRLGLDMREADTLAMRAQSMIRRRRCVEAHSLLREALQLMLDRGEPSRLGKVLGIFAGLANRMGNVRRAAVLLGATDRVIESAGVIVDALDRPLHQRTIDSVRRKLGEETFAAAWAEGRALTFENAVALARYQPDGAAESRPADRNGERLDAAVAVPNGLSPRELEVLRVIAAGRSTRELATDLGISEGTVERHVTNLYTKIGVHSRAEAAAYAFHRGLVSFAGG